MHNGEAIPASPLSSRNDYTNRLLRFQAAGFCVAAISASGTIHFSEESNCCNSAGSAEIGTNLSKSLSVNSRTSPSSFVNGLWFAIFSSLPIISLPKTDDANPSCRGQKTKDMQTFQQVSHCYDAILTMMHFAKIGSRNKVKLGCLFKAEVTLMKIALTLPRVERDLHR